MGRIAKSQEELELHKQIIDGTIKAQSSADLKVLLDRLNKHQWRDSTRRCFLLGLLQGALMQFKKDVSVEELQTIFRNR